MKKFLMYVIIVVTCLFLGFTIYYLTQNNENIYITVSKDESIYKNKDDSLLLDDLLVWTKPYKTTTLSIKSADENVVSYDENTKRFNCVGGGFTTITITPSNDRFGPFVFGVYVGDGTIANPYTIATAEELAKIGNDDNLKFTLSSSYILSKDIDLKSFNDGVWTPLGKFAGNFDGAGHIIYNLNITAGTNVGLFSELEGSALVEDVKFSNATLNGSFTNAGVVAGVNRGTIGKCEILSARLTNTLASGNTGAIVGSNIFDVTTGMVNMCSVKAEITSNGVVGGLVGYNKSSIVLNSRAIINSFEASASTAVFGGLVGVNKSTFDTEEEVYYASAIKNSYVVINKVTGSATLGAVVGENAEETYTSQSFFNTYVGCIYALETNVSMDLAGKGKNILTSDAKSNMTSVSKAQLLDKNTYSGYNFNTVWLINQSESANINYQGAYETYKIVAIGKEITPDQQSLQDFLNVVRANIKTNTTTYRVTKDVVVDLKNAQWETIAPNQSEPMRASIIVDDGVSCVITNFKLSGTNSSFFGYISGNTIIKGITFKDKITVESCDSDNSGIVATGLLNGATLDGVKVVNYNSIKTQAKNAGVICGLNKGTITNCSVECDELKELNVRLSDSLTSVGAIVGTNDGSVTNCLVDGVKVAVDISLNRAGSINLGGVTGTTSAGMSGNKVYGFVCDTTASGTVYAGGVVGYTTAGSYEIYKCLSNANISINSSNDQAFLGGITGIVSGGVTIKGSFYNNGQLSACNVGGLAGISNGTIFSCYVGGDGCQLTGKKVGGLVCRTYGKLTDCYVLSVLNSIDKKSVLCGLTAFVGPECYIEHCFSNAYFTGAGKFYAESVSEFRTWAPIQWFSNISNPTYWGPVINNIILVNNNAHVQTTTPIGIIKSGYIEVTKEECDGTTGNYSVFKDKAGFDTTIWEFDSELGFPTLKDIAVAD